ncbi:MAG: PEP-CTERM sorting domain-containing protein [Phycisphaeraceae bacterium]
MAQAAPIIFAGDHTLLPNTPGQIIQIMISGAAEDPEIEGVNLYLQIGNANSGPVITALELVNGTIFQGTTNFADDLGTVPAPQWQAAQGVTLLSPASIPVPSNGVLATLTLDTTGLTSGSWSLILDPSAIGTTDFGGAPATLINGTLSIPEPASLVLLAGLGVGWMGRRRASERH